MPPWLIFLLALTLCVNAGNSAWEAPSHGTFGQSAASSFKKRYFTIETNDGRNQLWDKGIIRYRFESPETKDKVFPNLEAAKNLWYASTLPETGFSYTEVSEEDLEKDRANTLLIKFNDEGILNTTPGRPRLDARESSYKGPTMHLSDRIDVGMLDVIANYAHELGHAWGMLHEHQNPAFWGQPYSNVGTSVFRLNCQNLKDWQEVSGRLTDPADQTLSCRDMAFAQEQKFSASEFLPMTGSGTFSEPILAADDSDVDWKSIMLYPSGAGGRGLAGPGNDQRLSVYVKASDGSSISINKQPSIRDVEGLMKIYARDDKNEKPVLISQGESSKQGLFKKIVKRQKCL